mgnify:CR=1 FL=1
MRLTVWDLIRYLYKHKFFIMICVVCSFILSKLYVDKIQTYSAEVVIRYKDGCVSNGYSLDGSKFDVNEIVSPKVIANANKDLSFNVTDDGIRANTKIIPIVPSSEEKLKESKQKLGEEYEYHPNVFKILYKGNHSYYETRDTLDKLIDNYFKYYNEKYLYLASVSEVDYDLNKQDYDYLEQAEILQSNIDSTISILESYVGNNEYRSPTTGLTFNDLINEFTYLSEFKLPLIFSRIYTARLTLDKDLLINKYTERKEQSGLMNKNNSEKATLAEDRMKAYVKANVDVPNSYNSNKNNGDDDITIIQDVHDDERRISSQTTYDTLIKNYVTDSTAANDNSIDLKQCEDIIKIFSSPADKSADYAEYEKLVKSDISDTLAKLKNLYTTAFELIDDYNAYVPSKHIESLTGIRYYKNVYSSLYYLIAVIIGFVLSCIIALAIEIMRRYAYFNKNAKHGTDGETLEPSSVIPDISTDVITEDGN